MENSKAILVDITKCAGCQECERACQKLHGYPEEHPTALSETALTLVEEKNGKYVRRMCLHCEEPACASACLVGALQKSKLGPVVYDAKKCMGCRYCMIACPQSIPKYEWSKLAPYVKKCDMCATRIEGGGQPACVEACPLGAAVFGDRQDLLRQAWERIRADAVYVPRVYGATEFGGTSVLFLTDVPFEQLGFVAPSTGSEPPAVLSAAAMGEMPAVVLIGGSMLSALYWITQRRREVALAESREHNDPARSSK